MRIRHWFFFRYTYFFYYIFFCDVGWGFLFLIVWFRILIYIYVYLYDFSLIIYIFYIILLLFIVYIVRPKKINWKIKSFNSFHAIIYEWDGHRGPPCSRRRPFDCCVCGAHTFMYKYKRRIICWHDVGAIFFRPYHTHSLCDIFWIFRIPYTLYTSSAAAHIGRIDCILRGGFDMKYQLEFNIKTKGTNIFHYR